MVLASSWHAIKYYHLVMPTKPKAAAKAVKAPAQKAAGAVKPVVKKAAAKATSSAKPAAKKVSTTTRTGKKKAVGLIQTVTEGVQAGLKKVGDFVKENTPNALGGKAAKPKRK
jgi:hypothetical protein